MEKFEQLEKNKGIEEKRRDRRIAARFSVRTPGKLDRYKDTLMIPITKEFLGETVLDLGAGYSGELPKHAAKEEIKLFSLSDSFSEEKYRKLLKKKLGRKINKKFPTIAGLAQELPFKSDSFDSVLSSWTIPNYLKIEEYKTAFREIVRVLKPGGRAYLGPISPFAEEFVKKGIKEDFKNEQFADINLDTEGVMVISKPEEKKDEEKRQTQF